MRRRLFVVGVSAAFAIASMSLTPGSAADLDPVAVSGPLPTGATAVAELLVLPSFGDAAGSETLQSVAIEDLEVSIADGRFSAYVDPAAIPAGYVQSGGIVDFQVVAEGGGSTWITSVSARLVAMDDPESPVWVDPVESAPMVEGDARFATVSGQFIRIPVVQRAAGVGKELEDDGVDSGDFAPAPGGEYAHCEYDYDGTRQFRSTTIGTTYPVGNSVAKMRVIESEGGKYGLAFRGVASGAEWYASGSKFTQDSWGFEWPYASAQRSYRKFIEYKRYDKTCGAAVPVYLGKEWQVIGETGGTEHNDGIDRPGWDDECTPADFGYFTRDLTDGSAYSYGAGVKFASAIGIDLSVERDYSENQFVKYWIKGPALKELCGSDDMPSRAGKVIERFR